MINWWFIKTIFSQVDVLLGVTMLITAHFDMEAILDKSTGVDYIKVTRIDLSTIFDVDQYEVRTSLNNRICQFKFPSGLDPIKIYDIYKCEYNYLKVETRPDSYIANVGDCSFHSSDDSGRPPSTYKCGQIYLNLTMTFTLIIIDLLLSSGTCLMLMCSGSYGLFVCFTQSIVPPEADLKRIKLISIAQSLVEVVSVVLVYEFLDNSSIIAITVVKTVLSFLFVAGPILINCCKTFINNFSSSIIVSENLK